MPGQYIYRFFKSTWGIYVNLTAEWVPHAEFKGTAFEVIPNVHLSIDPIADVIPEEHKFLVLAIKLKKHELDERLKEQSPIVIRILDVKIVLTDYLPEGLTYALVGWMVQELGIDASLPSPTFDKESKRYMFPDIFSVDE